MWLESRPDYGSGIVCGSRIMNKNPLLFSDLSVTQEYQLEEVSATCKTFSILGFSIQPPDFFFMFGLPAAASGSSHSTEVNSE